MPGGTKAASLYFDTRSYFFVLQQSCIIQSRWPGPNVTALKSPYSPLIQPKNIKLLQQMKDVNVQMYLTVFEFKERTHKCNGKQVPRV